MDLKENKNLTKWIVILPILGVLLSSIIITTVVLDNQYRTFDAQINDLQRELLNESKQYAYDRVEQVVSLLNSSKQALIDNTKKKLKTIIGFAINEMHYNYNRLRYLDKEDILQYTVNKFRNDRFFDNQSGYFFIYDLNGTNYLLPTNPELEKTNMLNLTDAKGKKTIQSVIKIIQKNGEGFDTWYWTKPGGSKMKKKIGYVKYFKPLGVFIGTAVYEEDLFKETKNIAKVLAEDIFQNSKETIFIYDSSGHKVLNQSDYKSFEREIPRVIRGYNIIGSGFFVSNTSSFNFKLSPAAKQSTSYVTYLDGFDWVIGSNTYSGHIANEIEQKKNMMRKEFKRVVFNTIIATFTVIFLLIIPMIFIAYKLQKILQKKHQDTLDQKELFKHYSSHDALTSLPNRIFLIDRLNQYIKHSRRDDKKIAILFIDIDKFKTINDTLGHNNGDELLKIIATRLKKAIRTSDTASRFGGDEFVLLIDDIKNSTDILEVIKKLRLTLSEPVELLGKEYFITASFGISMYPSDGINKDELFKYADIAMYKVKEEGGNGYRFFKSSMNKEIDDMLDLQKSLKIAVKQREFILYYQPVVDSKSNTIVSAEALIRWEHPKKGFIVPDDFIPIAENSNIIIDIGNFVTLEAMTQMVKWKKAGFGIKKIAINLALRQLEDKNFIDFIKQALKSTECDPRWVEFEIIERYAMNNMKKSIEVLNELRILNIGVSIDDFGTGYSSLSYIKNLPVTKLKIDRSFIINIENDIKDRAIVATIISLANGLKLKIITEGIETKEQKEFVEYCGCKFMQGYFFSKPVDKDKMQILLEKGSI